MKNRQLFKVEKAVLSLNINKCEKEIHFIAFSFSQQLLFISLRLAI